MLIPEAVSLVLMTSVISKAGDINVLRMGNPVKILDIAKALIATMGKSDNEVPIVFTGLRPGEKMFEELYLSGKELQTNHPDILTLPDGDTVNAKSMDEVLRGVFKLMENQNDPAQTKNNLMDLIS
jgi:FlaA1/EpsC-like NDP-sugar epimerase